LTLTQSLSQSSYSCQQVLVQNPKTFGNACGGSVSNLKGGGQPVTGQSNSALILTQVMDTLESCLQFDPELRPDLKSVRIKLRPLHKGM